MNLVLSYESSALAAPQSFRDGMQAAANILDSLIFNNITVTILVGYGDWNNNQDTGIKTGAEGGDLNGLNVSYTNLKTALATHETSAVDQTFVNSLPNTSSLNGVSNFYVPSAVDKALGLLSPANSALDGAVGIGTQISSSLLVGVALHELTHAMGREPGVGPFDLFRYTSPGNHLFSFSNTAVAAYFSIDGGNTKLADFGQTLDPSDFLNTGVQGSNDPFNEFYSNSTLQNLTAVDKELLDVLGFNTTPTTAPVVTVIEAAGSTSLVEIGNNFFLYAVGGSSGPELKYAGANVVAGQFGDWTPIGAEQTISGYEVAWKMAGADQYTGWNTDSSGNYISNNIGVVSGTSSTLESIETSFQQDLNGDGVIGAPTTVASAALVATVDALAPTPAFTNIVQNSNGTVTLSGTSEASSALSVYDGTNTTPLGTVTTDANGAWNFTTGILSNAIHSFTAKAVDVAGNVGSSSGVALYGTTSNDTLKVGPGNDLVTGGGGSDTFVFGPNFGKDVITDFQASSSSHDILQFSPNVFSDFASVLAHAAQVGSDIVITADAFDTVTLKNVNLSSLQKNDIHIV